MDTRIDDLEPEAQEKYRAFKALCDGGDLRTAVTFTHRSAEEQVALYAQGRQELSVINNLRSVAGMPPINATDAAVIVTNCDGIIYRSKHQDGKAFDMWYAHEDGSPNWTISAQSHPDDVLAFGVLGESVGLKWGGRFPPIDHNGIGFDPDHFEID